MSTSKKLKSLDSSQGAVEIPGDLWIEILARVPTDLVGKFRHLSKFHRDLINSPNFKENHKTSSSRSYVIVDGAGKKDHFLNKSDLTNSDPIQLHTLISPASNDSECIGCCEGILLLELDTMQESQHSRIMLWNPLTGATSPSFLKEPASYLLGHDAVTDDVKILQIPYHFYNEGDKCEIYSSKKGSWRKKSYNLKMQLKLERFHYNKKWAVFMEGTNSVHMMGTKAKTYEDIIVAYDFSTEEFKRIDLPVELRGSCVSLRSFNGCLCCYVGNPFSVWMMKEYGVVGSWTQVLSFDRPSRKYCLTPIDFVNGGRQIRLLSQRGVHLYDLEEKKLKKLVPFRGESKELVSFTSCFVYTPTLHKLFNT